MTNGNGGDSSKDRAAARALVKSVVLAQGNIFIRELLRRKKFRLEFANKTLRPTCFGRSMAATFNSPM